MISITNNITTLDGIIINTIKDYQSKYIELKNIAFDKIETIKDMHGNIFVKQKVDTQVEIEHKTIATEYPERPKGKWIRVVDKAGHWVWECEDCKWQQRIATNFCPDCGAEMRGENNGNMD